MIEDIQDNELLEIKLYLGFVRLQGETLDDFIKEHESIADFLKNVKFSIKKFLSIHSYFEYEIKSEISDNFILITFI